MSLFTHIYQTKKKSLRDRSTFEKSPVTSASVVFEVSKYHGLRESNIFGKKHEKRLISAPFKQSEHSLTSTGLVQPYVLKILCSKFIFKFMRKNY